MTRVMSFHYPIFTRGFAELTIAIKLEKIRF